MKVEVEVNTGEFEDEESLSEYAKPGVEATCPRCGHSTRSWGTGDVSIRRCLVLLREECPKGEKNFYVEESSSYD